MCLPQPGLVFGDQNCVSNGWGKDKFGAEGRSGVIFEMNNLSNALHVV